MDDGNDVGICRPTPALPCIVVGETCELKPGKYPGWYGGGGRSGAGGCTREWRVREECERSESDRGVNAPETGDGAVLEWTSTLRRFRGFGDCLP